MYLSVRVTESNIMVFPTTYYKLCKCYNFQRACGNYSRHTTQPLLRILVYRKRPVEQFGGSLVQSSDHNFDFVSTCQSVKLCQLDNLWKTVFSFLSSQHIKMHLKINEPHTFWIPYMKSIFDGFFYTSYLIV
jgi:hypothetical protein